MKQKKMKTASFKANAIGKPFDKGKFIEGKLKVLSDMNIALSEREMEMLHSFSTPRQIENFIRAVIISRWN